MEERLKGGWEGGWEWGREGGLKGGWWEHRQGCSVFDFCGVNTPHVADFPPTRSVQAELRSGGQVHPRHHLIPATYGSARNTSINHSKIGSGEF